MAYLKIFPIKVTDEKAIKYIMNPDKTDGSLLVSGYNCTPETAAVEFAMTREFAKNNGIEKGDNLAWHIVQSFKPGEITDPQEAHKIGIEFANQFLKGKYEYVLSTHTDKDHVHNHIIFCASSYVDYKKFNTNKRGYYNMCKISNRICREHGLSENMPKENRNTSYKEQMEYKKGTSWKAQLKFQVDKAIRSSISYDEFIMKMKQAGYEIRQGKCLAFKAEEQKHFTNVKTLGSYYTDEKIFERLEKNKHTVKAPKVVTPEVRLFIEISSFVQTENRVGFEKWAQRNNFQEAAKTFNYLSENNLLNYNDFTNHIEDVSNSIKATTEDLKQIEQDISNTQFLKKHCNNYRYCAEIVKKEPTDKKKDAYIRKHKSEYDLFKHTQSELKKLNVTKIPTNKKLDAKLTDLENRQSVKFNEIKALKKQEKELDVIKQNFQTMFSIKSLEQSEPEKDSKTIPR